jgi:CRP/FNR family transcriptional regulator, cyclic AMP receptor protein
MSLDETGPARGFWGLLTEAERESLRVAGQMAEFSPGATMSVVGGPVTSLFILLDGWVKIFSLTSDGHEIVLALRGPGDIVGEAGGLAAGHRTATVRAIDIVRSLTVRNDQFRSFLDSNPGAVSALHRVTARRWNDTVSMVRNRPVVMSVQRLAGVLLDLASQDGRRTDDGILVAMPLTQRDLASLAGASRGTVTRALSNWRARGIVRTGQRYITITDLTALKKIADPRAQSGS